MTFLPSTARWIPLLTQTPPSHCPVQKYSPASFCSTSRISRLTWPLSRSPCLLMRLSAEWNSTVSTPSLPNVTVSRGCSWSECRKYQVIVLLDVRLQVSKAFCPAWTNRAERRTGEAEDRWHAATPEEGKDRWGGRSDRSNRGWFHSRASLWVEKWCMIHLDHEKWRCTSTRGEDF